jgi:hypothetical protein
MKYGDKATLAAWAFDCAERVLPLFEHDFPKDKRPRDAIEAGRSWMRGEVKMWDARKLAYPAHAAARDAKAKPATAAARACGQALGTIHVKTHSKAAAIYAAKAVEYSGGDLKAERDWQIRHLRSLLPKVLSGSSELCL